MKKFNKIIDIVKSKWLRDTTKTAVLIVIIIAIFLGINILIQKLDPKDIDFTETKLYTLSEESKEKIASLPEEDKFEIYMFDFTEQDGITELIQQYAKINDNIKLEVLKSEDRPDLVSKYNVEEGYYTVVIAKEDKTKTFTIYDFSTYDSGTGNSIDITEQRMTNAIISLSSVGKNTVIYALTGHEERSINAMYYYKTFIELENYELKTLDLLSTQNIPEDCDGLLIASPKKDFTNVETDAIKEYIEKGGNILWLNDPFSASEETPHIKSLLDMYGVNLRQDGMIVEQDETKTAMGMVDVIYPEIEHTDVTENITQVLIFDTGKLEFAEDLEALNVTKQDILKTSETSFFRTNLENLSTKPTEDEAVGESVISAILEKNLGGEGEEAKSSKLVIFANNAFATDYEIMQTGRAGIGFYENRDLIVNATQYIADIEDAMTIRKEISVTTYTATEAQNKIVQTIIFSLPIIIIVLGIIVWQLRRRKK